MGAAASAVKQAVKATPEDENLVKDSLNALMDIADKNLELFIARIEGAKNSFEIPIHKKIMSKSVVQCKVSEDLKGLDDAIKKTIGGIAHGDFAASLTEVISVALKALLGSISGSKSETQQYLICIGKTGSIFRLDYYMYAYEYSSAKLTTAVKNVVCVAVYMASVDATKLDKNTVNAVLDSQYGGSLSDSKMNELRNAIYELMAQEKEEAHQRREDMEVMYHQGWDEDEKKDPEDHARPRSLMGLGFNSASSLQGMSHPFSLEAMAEDAVAMSQINPTYNFNVTTSEGSFEISTPAASDIQMVCSMTDKCHHFGLLLRNNFTICGGQPNPVQVSSPYLLIHAIPDDNGREYVEFFFGTRSQITEEMRSWNGSADGGVNLLEFESPWKQCRSQFFKTIPLYSRVIGKPLMFKPWYSKSKKNFTPDGDATDLAPAEYAELMGRNSNDHWEFMNCRQFLDVAGRYFHVFGDFGKLISIADDEQFWRMFVCHLEYCEAKRKNKKFEKYDKQISPDMSSHEQAGRLCLS